MRLGEAGDGRRLLLAAPLLTLGPLGCTDLPNGRASRASRLLLPLLLLKTAPLSFTFQNFTVQSLLLLWGQLWPGSRCMAKTLQEKQLWERRLGLAGRLLQAAQLK